MSQQRRPLPGVWNIPILPGQKPAEGRSRGLEGRFTYLRVGKVVRVDNIYWTVDVIWLDQQGGRTEVPLLMNTATPRAFMGFLPEVGSVVVCGFMQQHEFHGTPVVLGFLPSGIRKGYNFDPVKFIGQDEQIRYKMQKLYPGEGFFQSTQGTWIRLDHHLYAFASDLSGFWVDAFAHRIGSRSLHHVINSGRVKSVKGLVIRDPHPNKPGKASVDPMTLLDTRKMYVVTVDDSSLDDGGEAWVESRETLRETSDGVLDRIEEIEGMEDIYDGEILVEQVKGTLVGADPGNSTTFGKVLRRKIFGSADATSPAVSYEVISDEKEKRSLAEAYHLKIKNTTIDINKEGKIQIKVAASSSSDPLGAGRSIEVGLDGSVKLVVGSDQTTKRSIDISAAGAIKIAVVGVDAEGYAAQVELGGKAKLMVKGDLETEVMGNETHTVHGNRTVTVGGQEKRTANAALSDEAPIIYHN
jgi:hypothetical protein